MTKSVVITGASSGIGSFLTQKFLDEGWLVFGISRTGNPTEHPQYTDFKGDVFDEPFVIQTVRTIEKSSPIGALINNAGIASMNASLLSRKADFQNLFEVNFGGTFLFSREIAKKMLIRKEGRIVNLTSVAVPLALEGESLYSSSKAAVEQFTRVLASELGNSGITVNAVGPGPVQTKLTRTLPKEKVRALWEQLAISEWTELEDVWHLIHFLVQKESKAITGQTIYLNGAWR